MDARFVAPIRAEAPQVFAAIEDLGTYPLWLGIDDFGTGYSSLTYLRRFPVDFVKVDRTFVAGLGRDPEDEAIVRAVVSLGQALGLRTIGEGVETADQLALLEALGCDRAQGFYIAPPMPGAELEGIVGWGRLPTSPS